MTARRSCDSAREQQPPAPEKPGAETEKCHELETHKDLTRMAAFSSLIWKRNGAGCHSDKSVIVTQWGLVWNADSGMIRNDSGGEAIESSSYRDQALCTVKLSKSQSSFAFNCKSLLLSLSSVLITTPRSPALLLTGHSWAPLEEKQSVYGLSSPWASLENCGLPHHFSQANHAFPVLLFLAYCVFHTPWGCEASVGSAEQKKRK